MKMTIQQFQDKIANAEYQTFQQTIKLTKRLAASKVTPALQQLTQQLEEAMNGGYLAQGELTIEGLGFPVVCNLQLSPLNLPWQDAAKVSHFFDRDEQVELKFYLVTSCEFINASHLRIDQVATDAADLQQQQAAIVQLIIEQCQQAITNQTQTKEAAKKS